MFPVHSHRQCSEFTSTYFAIFFHLAVFRPSTERNCRRRLTDPEGSRPFIGALLLGYYDRDGRLIYAGRVGSGMRADQLEDLLRQLQPLQTDGMPLDVAPPRSTRFGSPLVLSRVHWVRPELVVEVKYLTWTDDGLLRQVVYEGIREDKPALEVVRETPSASAGR
jgi:ATP-dependent DNA ligase